MTISKCPFPIDAATGAAWIPEGAWVPKIGERVRIRLSGECQETFPSRVSVSRELIAWIEPAPHQAEEDNRTGTLTRMVAGVSSHPYVILFDCPYMVRVAKNNIEITAHSYSLSELEPLNDD